MLSKQATPDLWVVPPGDPGLVPWLGTAGAVRIEDAAIVFSLHLAKDQAADLLTELDLLAAPPRVAGSPAGAGIWLYIWPQFPSDMGLRLLLSEYPDVRRINGAALADRPCWACGHALWRLLGAGEGGEQ